MKNHEIIFWLCSPNDTVTMWDIISAIGPTIVAAFSIAIAVWQIIVQRKQKQITKQQTDLQRCAFVYDCFIRAKQEKLLELRKRYIEFKDICLYLLTTIFPCGVTQRGIDPGVPPVLNIGDTSVISFYSKCGKTGNADSFLKDGARICNDFLYFLQNNDVFLNDNPELFSDLKIISKDFFNLFAEIKSNEELQNRFISFAKQLDRIGDGTGNYDNNSQLKQKLIETRAFFYRFIEYRLMLKREKSIEWLLVMPPNSIFKNLKHLHDMKTAIQWSNDECIAVHTYAIFNTWFELTWLKYIDAFIHHSFAEIKKVIENDISKL